MPEINVKIGGRDYEVACQEGEEQFLKSAAAMLDVEASVLVNQIGHMPESRMLLMAGLMLADKTAGMDDSLKAAERKMADMQSAPASAPQKVEVPVIPEAVTDTLAEIAARAEAMAAAVEEKMAG